MSTPTLEMATLAEHFRGLLAIRMYGGLGYVDGWSIWTDGHCLIAVQQDIGLGAWTVEATKLTAERARAFIDKPAPADAVRVATADLRAFALQGRVLGSRDGCPSCNGTLTVAGACGACDGVGETECWYDCGRTSHAWKCSVCDGRGHRSCRTCGPLDTHPVKYGAIFGHLFNLNLTAEGLRYPVVESVMAALASEDEKDTEAVALRLWAEGYHFAQMVLRGKPLADTPRFEASP